MAGRFVLERGGVWNLGNGITIRAFRDKWVPTSEGFRVRPRFDDDANEDLRVT